MHRNGACVIHSSDLIMLSALEFTVNTRDICDISMCGRYGCGGVKAATECIPLSWPTAG